MSVIVTEQVRAGHPDKICDQIADGLLDVVLMNDPKSKVAIEATIFGDKVVVFGEMSSDYTLKPAYVDKFVNYLIFDKLGYTKESFGASGVKVSTAIKRQSRQIEGVVDLGAAGDQCTVYGFATRETHNMLPLLYLCACVVAEFVDELAKKKSCQGALYPDGKVQVSSRRINGKHHVDITVSCQHSRGSGSYIRELVSTLVRQFVEDSFGDALSVNRIRVNIGSDFELGGPMCDSGLSGRKIIADTYGGLVRHGGGSFSGKDPSKLDRSAAYMARHVARAIISGFPNVYSAEVSLSYLFGEKHPVGIWVRTSHAAGLPLYDDPGISNWASTYWYFSPNGIIAHLNLRDFFSYFNTATYGHFTNHSYPWEIG